MNFSFDSKRRIKKSRDFQKIFSNGKVITNDWLVCRYVKNDLGYARLGIVVSRKFGKAHIRNRFKRYVRETFRITHIEESVDVLVLPKRELKDVFKEMSFDSFSKKLRLLLMGLKENFGES